MRCFQCGKAAMARQAAEVESTVREERYKVETPALVCARCGNVAIEGDDMQEFMRRGADAYRRAHGLLTSGEIRERRKRLNMNQREFAAHLCVGEASVKRWELGAIQDAAMNELMVLKTDPVAAQSNVLEVKFRITGGVAPSAGHGRYDALRSDVQFASGVEELRPGTGRAGASPGGGEYVA